MTTVEFGGGPDLEARKQFISLKSGGEIPKYAGHVHQLRFHQGHTFTEETHRVAQENVKPIKRATSLKSHSTQFSDPYVTREFPDGLIPGYAGYVPQWKFQHGNRFRVETDVASVSSKNSYDEHKKNYRDFQNLIQSYPKTQSLNNGTVVKHFLDYHRAHHPTEASQQEDRRSTVEPPIPGYKGYIPRLGPFNMGVGSRYHDASQTALNRFAVETSHSTTNLPTTAYGHRVVLNPKRDESPVRPSSNSTSPGRLYPQSGMIPRYFGYVPQRKYRVGQTFGDTTRDLPVCSHSYPNYGDAVRSSTII